MFKIFVYKNIFLDRGEAERVEEGQGAWTSHQEGQRQEWERSEEDGDQQDAEDERRENGYFLSDI